MALKNPIRRKVIRWISWSKPETGYIKLNSDGAVANAQSRAGCGGVFRNENGDWLLGFHMNLGCCSSKVAELEGIRAGLLIARNNGWRNIYCETDASSVVEALMSEAKDNSLMSSVVEDCKSLLQHLQTCSVHHVHREGNRCADALAKLGLASPVFIHNSSRASYGNSIHFEG
ncbi:Ribonuclease H [Quillaja saponaria]|uniref:Ribonuclease H n=1 Tax=Quillaja saponaria TaxID=32244 RepID=A0AAD7QJ57_QUISA|nr:Ribonuclease H [Quillaja saponaria]